ncbi:hypothetical protein A9179_11630 [Pseudomonas alcaligenes]|uniref:Fatty acid desaturase domain-containing protein n=1 Tax=Aquipseudomonas alcaligenes TaxID=43263 RepID=A0ABR7S1D9_AQUAC|nr:hypothetical protein [Pseudomonas alcaligenes]
MFVFGLLLWVGAIVVAEQGLISPAVALFLQTVAAFAEFTVMHEGVHHSLLRGHPKLNAVISGIAAVFLGVLASRAAFRYLHFKHHRLTNESGDPDLWSGKGSAWRKPLQWLTADIGYAVATIKDWSKIPAAGRREMVLTLTATFGVLAVLVSLGYGKDVLLYWLLPARLAILWLAFAFNYLPHHPHKIEQRHNPYAASNVREGGEPIMRLLCLYQNYHLIHHLFPSVPFYRYARIWERNRSAYIELGAQVRAWHGMEPKHRD